MTGPYAGLGPADLYEREPERREEVLPALWMSPRDLWIRFGNLMRGIDPAVWIRGVLDNPAYDNDCVVLVSDVRYGNEVEAIHEHGGLVMKVARVGVPESDDVADSALAAMPDAAWDHIVRNNGDLSALADRAREVAGIVRERMRARTPAFTTA